MKKLFFSIFLSILAISIFAQSNDKYVACCGVSPVEYGLGGANIFIPNVFTPNSDGINDIFLPFFGESPIVISKFIIETLDGELLFERPIIDYRSIADYSWDGNRADGTPYIGLFKYHFRATHATEKLARFVEGEACRIQCGEEAAVFKTKQGCFFSTQLDEQGHFNPSLSNQEGVCIGN